MTDVNKPAPEYSILVRNRKCRSTVECGTCRTCLPDRKPRVHQLIQAASHRVDPDGGTQTKACSKWSFRSCPGPRGVPAASRSAFKSKMIHKASFFRLTGLKIRALLEEGGWTKACVFRMHESDRVTAAHTCFCNEHTRPEVNRGNAPVHARLENRTGRSHHTTHKMMYVRLATALAEKVPQARLLEGLQSR